MGSDWCKISKSNMKDSKIRFTSKSECVFVCVWFCSPPFLFMWSGSKCVRYILNKHKTEARMIMKLDYMPRWWHLIYITRLKLKSGLEAAVNFHNQLCFIGAFWGKGTIICSVTESRLFFIHKHPPHHGDGSARASPLVGVVLQEDGWAAGAAAGPAARAAGDGRRGAVAGVLHRLIQAVHRPLLLGRRRTQSCQGVWNLASFICESLSSSWWA